MKRITTTALLGTLLFAQALPTLARATEAPDFQSMSSDETEKYINIEADRLEATPASLKAQGKECSPSIEKKIKSAAEQMRNHAKWDEVKAVLRKASTHVGTALIDDVGQTIAASGEIFLIAPLNIIENFAAAVIFGKHAPKIDAATAFVVNDQDGVTPEQGASGGAMVFTVNGAVYASGLASPVIIAGGAGAILTAVCEVDNSEYCRNEIRLIHEMMASGEESIGQFLGMQIHYAGADVVKGVTSEAHALGKDAHYIGRDSGQAIGSEAQVIGKDAGNVGKDIANGVTGEAKVIGKVASNVGKSVGSAVVKGADAVLGVSKKIGKDVSKMLQRKQPSSSCPAPGKN